MTQTKHWKEIEKNADLYRKLGQVDHYLDGDNDAEYPWHLVSGCEPGSTHRLNISTGVWFKAQHPSGLSFRWSFDIEPYSANGKSGHHIDTAGIRHVFSLLNGKALTEFQHYLSECAVAIQKSANEYQEAADKEQMVANILKELGQR